MGFCNDYNKFLHSFQHQHQSQRSGMKLLCHLKFLYSRVSYYKIFKELETNFIRMRTKLENLKN